MPPTQRFSQTPKPVGRGKEATVCYDFTGTTLTVATATVQHDPDGNQPTSLEFTPAENCKTFMVPVNAAGIVFMDNTQTSMDYALDIEV